jgi:hypothetical protein
MATSEFRADRTQTAIYTAVGLLLFGGLIALLGWIVGAVLVWRSSVWTRREKLLGTLVLPFGLLGSLMVINLDLNGSAAMSVLALLLALAPLVTCSYLAYIGRRRVLA